MNGYAAILGLPIMPLAPSSSPVINAELSARSTNVIDTYQFEPPEPTGADSITFHVDGIWQTGGHVLEHMYGAVYGDLGILHMFWRVEGDVVAEEFALICRLVAHHRRSPFPVRFTGQSICGDSSTLRRTGATARNGVTLSPAAA